MTLYLYHTWDALNYYDKNGYRLFRDGEKVQWTNEKNPVGVSVGNAYSFRSTSTGEVFSKTPYSKLAQYSLEI